MQATQLLMPVPFYEDTVVLVGKGNEPFVAMKPIVTNMGLSWDTQFRKISEKFATTIVDMTTVAEDGRLREMTCLPLRKLTAWLYSISPNKVKPELRDKIIRYQEECDDALWAYWSKGGTTRPEPPNVTQQIALSRHRITLIKELSRARDNSIRAAIHEQLTLMSRQLGLSTPELDSIGVGTAPAPDVLIEFWEALEFLDQKSERYNHCTPLKGFIYLNLTHLALLFTKHKIQLKFTRELREAMKNSKQPRFVSNSTKYSTIEAKPIKCWEFEGPIRPEREFYEVLEETRKSQVEKFT